MSTKVLEFKDTGKHQRVSADSETPMNTTIESQIIETSDRLEARVHGTAALLPIDVLYPAAETKGNRTDLFLALELLAKAIKSLEGARDAFVLGDIVQADQQIQLFQSLLPGLFRCRTIGDGFGCIVNALEIAFVNQQGQPLTQKQVQNVLRTIKELRHRPFVSFESAQQSIEEFENAGLKVDPVILSDLLDASE